MVQGCILTGYGEEVQMTHQWEPVMRRGVARHWCHAFHPSVQNWQHGENVEKWTFL